jgi:dienelactone hydrolase
MNIRKRFSTSAIVTAIAAAVLFPAGSRAIDGVMLDNSGAPKGRTPHAQMQPSDWSDPAELERTLDGAKVRVPLDTGVIKASMRNLKKIPEGEKFPTVIYMHGCNGFWPGTDRRVDFLASLKFAVIAPDSFAREKAPTSCDVSKHKAGMYRPTLIMRQNEAAYAIRQARKLPWVDGQNIFLMGLSQGGIATATFRGEPVSARVIEGWGCHAGWPEYHGLNAPQTEPVLSLVADKDPWFRSPELQGDCGEFMMNNASRSVVFKSGSLSYRHELLEYPKAKDVVRQFLEANIR